MPIGNRLFNLRQKTGQSLQGLADSVGISKAHIWELEKGHSKNPSFDLVRKLAVHFGVSIDELVGDADEPKSEALQIERLHRGLDELSDRDRNVVEDMIKAMKARGAEPG